MTLNAIIADIDAQIARLQEARALLAAAAVAVSPSGGKRGRPKKNQDGTAPSQEKRKKRNLSPEGRARIADAVKRRWAKQKG